MTLRKRRISAVLTICILLVIAIIKNADTYMPAPQKPVDIPPNGQTSPADTVGAGTARAALEKLEVKGRAPNTGYTRAQFGDGWENINGCDTRNTILYRDLKNAVTNEKCQVVSGTLNDPYTGKTIAFVRGEISSQAVQIDHVVALNDAWQKGAQNISYERRVELANDPLELLAVDGEANQQKSNGDAATWLPSNKSFRCQYVARQIAVKQKYKLWISASEKDAIIHVLSLCPQQPLPQSTR